MKKKKIELIEELQSAEHLLLEKHEELIICQDELARLMTEQNQLKPPSLPFDEETLTMKLEVSNKELESVQKDLAKIEAQLAATNKKLALKENQLKDANNKLTEAHHELRGKTDELDKSLSELIAARKDFNALANEFDTALATIESHKKAKQTIPTSSYSFRLDVYPRSEDAVQSRIEHLLTGERQALSGLDTDTIVEFVRHYLPVEEHYIRGHATPESNDSQEVAIEEKEISSSLVINPYLNPDSRLRVRAAPTETVFTSYHPFQLQIQVQAEPEVDSTVATAKCQVSVYARNLNQTKTVLLGVIDEPLSAFKSQNQFMMNAIGLPSGFYRLDTVASFNTEDNEPLPISIINEGSFIHIN